MKSKLARRDFIRVGTAAAAGVLVGCKWPRRWVQLEPYVRPPEEQLAGEATWYASTCRQCPAGCGIIVRVMNGRALKIEGNPEHPLNRGKLCARGQAGLQLLYNPDLLLGPVQQPRRTSREFQPISWNEGLNTLITQLQGAGDSVAVWLGSTVSGHLHDLFQRFTQAIHAPPPVSLDLYSLLQGYGTFQSANQALFGHPEIPAYDLGQADMVLSFGADFLGTWFSAVRYGIEYGKFRNQPLGKRGWLTQIEPRMSMTGAKADGWLPIHPGTEGLIAQALIRLIADQKLGSPERISRAQALAGSTDIQGIAEAIDVPMSALLDLARAFGHAARPLAIPGAGLMGQDNDSGAAAWVQALNVVAGTFSAPGGLLSSPTIPTSGLVLGRRSSWTDFTELVARLDTGKVKALLVYGANPVYDLPGEFGGSELVRKVPFVVSFSPIVDDTALWADLVLPDRTYLEAWGYEVVSPNFGTPMVSSQQPVVSPRVDSRATADVLLAAAKRLPSASDALPWQDEVSFLKESIAALPPGSAGGSGSDVLWARYLQHGGWWPAVAPTPGPLEPTRPALPAIVAANLPAEKLEGDKKQYPYLLYLYVSDLLSDGRGASQPWLQGSPDPMTTNSWQTWVEIHPELAQKLGIRDGDIVQVASPHGRVAVLALIYPAIRPDTLAMPTGQGHKGSGRYAEDRGANPMRLLPSQTAQAGDQQPWSVVRANVVRTGEHSRLAVFENIEGVSRGFTDDAFPR